MVLLFNFRKFKLAGASIEFVCLCCGFTSQSMIYQTFRLPWSNQYQAEGVVIIAFWTNKGIN